MKAQTEAEVHYVTKSTYQNILINNPNIDKVYSFENEITEVVDQLKEENYDFVVDLHNNIRSVRLKKSLKKPSAAFPKLNPKKWLLTNFKWNLMPDVHVVDRYFEAVKSLGVKSDGKGLDYFIPETTRVDVPDNFIAFGIGAKFATKRLPNDKIIELINKIDKTVVLLGGPTDVENAEEITSSCENIISLVGKLNLEESALAIQKSELLITHDTGLMHIASALNKKIISIWGNTVPDLGMYPYMPEHPELYSIHEVDLKCRPCSKIGYDKCPKGHFKCMKNQDVNAILKSI